MTPLEVITSKVFGEKYQVKSHKISLFYHHLGLILLEVDDVVRDVARQAQVDHPVHEVEGDEHDGEDDPAVLVDITGPHAEYPGGRVGWQGGGLGHRGQEGSSLLL